MKRSTTALLICVLFNISLFSKTVKETNTELPQLITQNPKAAIKSLKRSLKSSHNDYIIYKNLGLAYIFLAKYDSALVNFNKSLKILRKTSQKNELIDVINNIGLCYESKNDYKKAFTYFNKAKELSKKISYLSGLADSYSNLGNLYWKTSRYKKAMIFYNKALSIYKNIKDQKAISYTLNNLGNTYYKIHDYKTAVNFYIQSLKIKDKINESKLPTLNNIATLYIKLNENEKALNYFQKAIDLSQTSDKKNLSQIYSNIATIYTKSGNTKQAMKYLNKALKIKNDINDTRGISIVLNKIGELYTKEKKYDIALRYFLKSYKIRQNLSYNEGIANVLFNIGNLYLKKGNLKKAKNYFIQAEYYMKKYKNYEGLENIYEILSKIESQQKNYKNSLYYIKRALTLKDTIFTIKNEKQIRDLLTKYEMEQKEKQIEILNKNKKIIELNLSKQRTLAYTFIFGFILISFLALYIWKIKQDELNTQKEMQNKTEKMNRELAARVKEELIKAEKQRQLLIQKSKLESLGKLSAGIAHEINQPLGGITMALENIHYSLIEQKEGEEYYLKKLEDIKKYIARISMIINHIRVFSRDQGLQKIEEFNPIESIENAISIIGTQYKKRNIIIKKSYGSCQKIKGNKYKLEQVILNLFTNAKDALDEKKETYKKIIEISLIQKDNECIIQIKDNGIGIPQNIIDKIFDPFFTTKSPEKGTGLGLSIAYGIIKEMHGEIKVTSKTGETVFYITLPLIKNFNL